MGVVDVSKLIAFEEGELNDLEVVDLFQELVDSGLAWSLQGEYGRLADKLIKDGYVIRTSRVPAIRE